MKPNHWDQNPLSDDAPRQDHEVQEVLGELQERPRKPGDKLVTDKTQRHTGQIARDVYRD